MKNYLDKLDKYKKAVNSLTEMLKFESSFDTPLEKLNEALRDSLYINLNLLLNLFGKQLKNILKKKGYEEINSPRKVLKQAFEIKDEVIWSNMLEARNSTAHKYDEEQAIFYEDVIKKKYFKELNNLLEVLLNEK